METKAALSHNHFYNILKLFDVLPNFPFTTSETMDDYYLETWYIRGASRVSKRRKKLGNIRKVPKLHKMTA